MRPRPQAQGSFIGADCTPMLALPLHSISSYVRRPTGAKACAPPPPTPAICCIARGVGRVSCSPCCLTAVFAPNAETCPRPAMKLCDKAQHTGRSSHDACLRGKGRTSRGTPAARAIAVIQKELWQSAYASAVSSLMPTAATSHLPCWQKPEQ